jgi:hypothetical protein
MPPSAQTSDLCERPVNQKSEIFSFGYPTKLKVESVLTRHSLVIRNVRVRAYRVL